MINLGILDKFHILLNSKDGNVRMEIYWGLSNILASTVETIERVLGHDIFENILSIYPFEDYKVHIKNYFFFTKIIFYVFFKNVLCI